MNKVTTINLSGQAFQLEEKAYESLHTYLESARRELADDPDKDEVMQDFEQAIADKCTALLNSHKNVITTAEIKHIISAMGEVEAARDEAHESQKKQTSTQSEPSAPKRFYLLREGAIIGGVCNGLAAYFNIDVTIMRLLFIVLTFASGGFWIIVYLLAMLIVPVATTPEQKAELRGERFTAQGVISRAKQKYADLSEREHWQKAGQSTVPALQGAGRVTIKIMRVLYIIVAMVLGVIIAAISSAWITGMWWLATGSLHLADQLHGIPNWIVMVALTATYIVTILPIATAAQALIRLGRGRRFYHQDIRWLVTVGILWVIACGVLGGMQIAYHSRINAYGNTHATITIEGHRICINDDLCGNNGQNETPLQLDQNPPHMRYFLN